MSSLQPAAPYTHGNVVSTTHGGRSPRIYNAVARLLAQGLVEERPDLAEFPEAVAAWAEAEAIVALLRRHVAEVGAIDPETNQPRESSLDRLSKAERNAAKMREPLGLDPISNAKLTKERASAAHGVVDLAAIAARGREALAARTIEGEASFVDHDDIAGRVLGAVKDDGIKRQRQAELEQIL